MCLINCKSSWLEWRLHNGLLSGGLRATKEWVILDHQSSPAAIVNCISDVLSCKASKLCTKESLQNMFQRIVCSNLNRKKGNGHYLSLAMTLERHLKRVGAESHSETIVWLNTGEKWMCTPKSYSIPAVSFDMLSPSCRETEKILYWSLWQLRKVEFNLGTHFLSH